MASMTPISQSQCFLNNPHFKNQSSITPISLDFHSRIFKKHIFLNFRRKFTNIPLKEAVVVAAATEKRYPGEAKGFAMEMRLAAMKLHTKDQAKEGEKEPRSQPAVAKWEPSIEGYLRFLLDSNLVFDMLEGIVEKAAFPSYTELRNTRLERSEKLAKDLKWFKEKGHSIPEPSSPGLTYAHYLQEISKKDPQAFLCHFYNVYFGQAAGVRMIGEKVAGKLLNNKELEFYKWDGDLSQLLQNAREKLNKVAENWTREEKNHCLEETEISFKYSEEIIGLILS